MGVILPIPRTLPAESLFISKRTVAAPAGVH